MKEIRDEMRKITLFEIKKPDDFLNISDFFDYLFDIIRISIREYEGNDNLEQVIKIINYIKEYSENCFELDRKFINRKIVKVYEEIERKLIEDRKKLAVYKNAQKELTRVEQKIDDLCEDIENKETFIYEFVEYIVNYTNNIEYLRKAFTNAKNLVNIKDRNGVSLFRKIVAKYLESVSMADSEKILYYNNILVLMGSQSNFKLNYNDRKKALNRTYTAIDKLKKKDKDYKLKKFWLDSLVTYLKPEKLDDKNKQHFIENIAKKYHVSAYFPLDIMSKVKLKESSNFIYDGRYIIDEYIFSIDNDKTKIIDDAISCRKLDNGNYLLGIHIADILGYYDFSSNVIQDALTKTLPIYIDNFLNIPLLSDDVRKNASLDEGKVRYARSYMFELSEDGEILDNKIIKTIINNNKRLDYNELNRYLTKPNKTDCELIESINNIKYLYNKKYGKDATDLVSIATSFVNNSISDYFYNEGYPCIYIGKNINEDISREELIKKIEIVKPALTEEEYNKLIRSFSIPLINDYYYCDSMHEYSSRHHTTATSPLRKANDILVNYATDICYFNNPSDVELYKLEEYLNDRATYMNNQVDNIRNFITDISANVDKFKIMDKNRRCNKIHR